MVSNPALHKACAYGAFVIIVLVSVGCRSNGKACTQPCILVSNTTNILSINSNNGAVSSVVSGLTRAVAMDIDFRMGHVFWSDIVEKKIKRMDIDGTNLVTVVQNIGVCDGLAVEWRSRLLYWSDVTLDRIEVAKLDGNDRLILISTGLSQPRAVVVEPEAGFLFWTDWGTSPKVERSTLSGESRMAIITSRLKWPNGLTVDFDSRVIYWVDSWLDKIESSDYEGNGRRLVSKIPGTRAFGLVLFGSSLLWSNWAAADGVRRVDNSSGLEIQSYLIKGRQTMGITVFNQARQPKGARTCHLNPGGCSHLCLLKPGGYTCACPTGSKLKNDSKTCDKVELPSFYLVATETKIIRVNYATGASQTLKSGFKGNLAIDVDVRKKRMYWSNSNHRAIFKANIDGKSVRKIIERNIGVCGGLAVEWRSRLLYWTDSTFDKIEVASLNGQNRRVLFHDDLNDPWGIAVEPETGYLFFTTINGISKIERSSLSGKNRKKIVTTGIEYPTGITIDYANRRIYWVDGFFGKIEFADYEGNNRQRLQENPTNTPTYLTVSGSFVYWTDRGLMNSVSKIPKEPAHDSSTQKIVILSETPFGIAYFDQSRQLRGRRRCSASKRCSHLCLLDPDGHVCACPDGLLMSIDQNTCQAASEIPEFLMVVQEHSKVLTLLSPDGRSSLLQLLSRDGTVTAVDYNPIGRSFVFARKSLKSSRIEILFAWKSRTISKRLAACNILSPESLAVDWRGENVYWTDSQKGTIEVIRVKGRWRTVLHRDLDNPKALALQQDLGLMAWSECGMFPKILSSNMDGSEKAFVINTGFSCALDLIFDRILKKIYWRNAWINTVEMSNLDGSGRETVLRKDVSAFTMTIRFLYWSEGRSGTLYRRSRTGNNRVEIVSTNLKAPFIIKAYTKEILSDGLYQRSNKSNASLCSHSNGDCDHVCLSAPNRIKCACSSGYSLQKDNKSCEISRSEGSLLIADTTRPLTRLPLTGDKFTCSEKLLDNKGARAITYDPRTKYIYWSSANFILRAKNDNKTEQSFSPTERIAAFQNSMPNWLAIDWISGNLFWTFLDRKNIISVSRADGTSKKALITDATNIEHIAINPIKGRLYWTESGSVPKIMMSNMDGESRRTIVVLGLKAPMAVAVDHFNDRIFWIDSGTQKIEQSDFEGNNRIVIFRLPDKNPRWGLVYFKNTLYWTNPRNERLESVNITSQLSRTMIIGLSRTSYGLAMQFENPLQGTNQCEKLNGGCSNLCFPTVYGRECACPDGIELRSDDVTTCEGVNRCPVLHSPQHGTKEECRNVPGIDCRFFCDYSHRIVGSEVRTCLQNGSWSGVQPRCESFMCPAILPPKYGSMDGASGCNDVRELPYNSYCVFRCSRPGFERQGPAFTRCLLNGTWSVNSSSVICKDTQSPKITCPQGVKLFTDTGKSTALYNWTVPKGEDNSGDFVRVQVKNPEVVPPYRFPYGVTVVEYIAEDTSQLQSDCSFTVEVKDDEPPRVVHCPKDYKIISVKQSLNVTLPYVGFSDNVEIDRIIYDGPINGSGMHWGKHPLHFTAYDKDQNVAKCIFTIEIISKTCHLDPPLHGAMSCETWLEGGRYCSIRCNRGFEFAVNVQDIYFCDGKGLWRNVPMEKGQPKLPDCSPLQMEKENFIQAAVRYKADSCYDPAAMQLMKTDFINKFKTNIFGLLGGCIGHTECRVENVEVVCGKDTSKRRKKRSVDNYVITIQFEIKLPAGNESFVTAKEINSTSEILNATASKFVNIVQTIINSSSLDINIGNKTLQASRKNAVLVNEVGMRCHLGQKRVGSKCVSCPLGTYHNATTDECVPCPVDSYQDQEGQLSCQTCPAGSSTWGVKGARWIDYCTVCENRFKDTQTGHCIEWEKQGYCKSDQFVMAKYCPLDCGFCGTCPALDHPEGMIFLPPKCAKKRVPIGTTCTILCEDGYKLAVRSKLFGCFSNGTWSDSVWDYKCLRIAK